MAEPVAARKVQRALVYLAAIHGDDPARIHEARGEALRWRHRSDEHERAWQEAEQRWQLVHRMAPQLRGAIAPQPHDPSRRRLLRQGGALALLLGAGSWLGWLYARTGAFQQDLLTAHAEAPRPLALPDGSQLLVAAQSNLRIRFDHAQRQVMLLHGNVYFDVAHEWTRRFLINTRSGSVQVLGTAFTVSDRGERVYVAVTRGRVQVRDLHGGERVLHAGERIDIDDRGRLGELRKVVPLGSALDHWQRGWWSFTDQSLREVAGELNAYLAQPVELAGEVAELRLTASFPADRPQQLLETLPRILPVRLEHQQGKTRVQPR